MMIETDERHFVTGLRLMAEISCQSNFEDDPTRVNKKVRAICKQAEGDEVFMDKAIEFGRDSETLLGSDLDYKTRVSYETGLTLVCFHKLGMTTEFGKALLADENIKGLAPLYCKEVEGVSDDQLRQMMWEEFAAAEDRPAFFQRMAALGAKIKATSKQ